MQPAQLLNTMRAGKQPDPAALASFARGLADGSVSDAQAGAFAMAVCLSGLGDAGRTALTLAMRDSGRLLRWDLPGPVLDKHSTGGVGDCVSLVLAPALAALGVYVPMISGRGLGHTGGTLDKLDAIPGFRTALTEDAFRRVVSEAGCAIVGASAAIAPADARLYAVRDVTGTVASTDLITASILSKKLAAGLEGLVLDVKVGSGAFMKTQEDARALARSLVTTANDAGCPTVACLTDMNSPVAPALGNAVEVAEAMLVLRGAAPEGNRLAVLTTDLGAALLVRAGMADDLSAGRAKIAGVLADGRATEAMGRMIYAQGGPLGFVENPGRFLPEATVIREVTAPANGHISAIDGEALGRAVVDLGGGRRVESDPVDPAVGLSDVLGVGAAVARGQPLLRIHAARIEDADRAAKACLAAITITEDGPSPAPSAVLLETLGLD
ncbi:Thymidine phosphorylase [Roseivivax sp. THAF40]|uniref:thymidine phosphorylase n=1 Tax=unclassified Roseivivax TaxID=2639302 RepID=UPI00126912D3|nr:MULTISPECIES: thymidine phosphorylase [unclassified Roseivivax]QFS81799.1 Thymidine phosphorylase [Roseivivax sp. THAF197b]QFT45599.1 Thymidine phosphorylase [Roseivivax sp. THAF40]